VLFVAGVLAQLRAALRFELVTPPTLAMSPNEWPDSPFITYNNVRFFLPYGSVEAPAAGASGADSLPSATSAASPATAAAAAPSAGETQHGALGALVWSKARLPELVRQVPLDSFAVKLLPPAGQAVENEFAFSFVLRCADAAITPGVLKGLFEHRASMHAAGVTPDTAVAASAALPRFSGAMLERVLSAAMAIPDSTQALLMMHQVCMFFAHKKKAWFRLRAVMANCAASVALSTSGRHAQDPAAQSALEASMTMYAKAIMHRLLLHDPGNFVWWETAFKLDFASIPRHGVEAELGARACLGLGADTRARGPRADLVWKVVQASALLRRREGFVRPTHLERLAELLCLAARKGMANYLRGVRAGEDAFWRPDTSFGDVMRVAEALRCGVCWTRMAGSVDPPVTLGDGVAVCRGCAARKRRTVIVDPGDVVRGWRRRRQRGRLG
jgi:hypothetical protein